MILLDTNLLTRMTRSHDPRAGVARAAIRALLGRGERLIVVPQNLYEFWALATRPPGAPPAGRNGLGMTPVQAGHRPRVAADRHLIRRPVSRRSGSCRDRGSG